MTTGAAPSTRRKIQRGGKCVCVCERETNRQDTKDNEKKMQRSVKNSIK